MSVLEEDDGEEVKAVSGIDLVHASAELVEDNATEVQEEEDEFFFEGSLVQEEREVAEE